MKKSKKIISLLLALVLVASPLTACNKEETKTETPKTEEAQKETDNKESEELIVYSGAGLKKPMEKIKDSFEKETNKKLNIIYAGSGQLLAQLEQSGKGDIFIVGSKATYDAAVEKDLAEEGVGIAHHTPVIITAKGNPKGIKTLQDLAKDDVKVALGEPESNAIGKTSIKLFEKNKIEGVDKNVAVQTATVNELYQAIANGNADVAIVTRDGALGHDDLEIIEIPEDQNIDQIINAGVLKTTKEKKAAEDFLTFLTSDESLGYFEEFGFKPAK